MKKIIFLSVILVTSLFANDLATLKKQSNGTYEGYAGKMFFQIESEKYKDKTLDDKEIKKLYEQKKRSICKDKYRNIYTQLGGVLNITVAYDKALMVYSEKCNTENEFHNKDIMTFKNGMFTTQKNRSIFMMGVMKDNLDTENKKQLQSDALDYIKTVANKQTICNKEMIQYDMTIFFIVHGVFDKSYVKMIRCK